MDPKNKKIRNNFYIAAFLILLLTISVSAGTINLNNKEKISEKINRRAVLEKMNVLPASFILNKGQVPDSNVRYILKGTSTSVYLTDNSMVFSMSAGNTEEGFKNSVFKMTLAGANKTTAKGLEKLNKTVNYFIGSDSSKWHTDIPAYGRVNYENVYSGIDMAVWGSRTKLKYEFHVAPGKDAKTIQIDYSGIEGLSLDDSGNLHIKTAAGRVIDYAPFAYQDIAGKRVKVDASYRLIDEDSYGFSINDDYDKTRPLVIDPDLLWSTYLGGNGFDDVSGIAVDTSGNVYVTGYTNNTNFPTTTGAYNESLNGDWDVFVTKLSSDSNDLSYSTFIGGNDFDRAQSITVDNSGNAYVTGDSRGGFPTTSNAFDQIYNGDNDVFVLKLNSAGNSLLYSTYVGGSVQKHPTFGANETGRAITLDGFGGVYVAGVTTSADFPTTTGAYDRTHNNYFDAFIFKMTMDTPSYLLYSTLLGSSGSDYAYGVDVYNGDIFITGICEDGFPTTSGAYDTSHNGTNDGFVAQISPDGNGNSDLVYSTLLGGDHQDTGISITVDSFGDVYIGGCSTKGTTTDFPTTTGAYDETHNGNSDGFIAKLSPDGNGSSDLISSTFIGSSDHEIILDIALIDDEVYAAGYSNGTSFPTTSAAYNNTLTGGSDVVVCVLSSDLSDLLYSTYIGGSLNDVFSANLSITVDSSGNMYVAASTQSTDFPTTTGAYDQSHNGGNYDGFVLKLKPIIDNVENVTSGSWYQTIQSAIDDANDLDEIVIHPGVYNEVVDLGSKKLTLRGSDPNDWDVVKTTVIDSNSLGGWDYWGHNTLWIDQGQDSDMVVKGLTVKGGYCGIYCGRSTAPVIEKCIVTDNYIGIYCNLWKTNPAGEYPLIQNNIVHNNTAGIIGSNRQSYIEVVSSIVHSNTDCGIKVFGKGGKIINNTVVNNAGDGIYTPLDPNLVEISNCVLWNNLDDLDGCLAGYSCIKDGDSGTGNISTDPGFADPNSCDYHLTSGSPCIDAGDNSVLLAGDVDIDGDARKIEDPGTTDTGSGTPPIVDMGADEYNPN